MREHIMIVDGYNVIGNWPELAKLKAEDHFDVARDRLLDILACLLYTSPSPRD